MANEDALSVVDYVQELLSRTARDEPRYCPFLYCSTGCSVNCVCQTYSYCHRAGIIAGVIIGVVFLVFLLVCWRRQMRLRSMRMQQHMVVTTTANHVNRNGAQASATVVGYTFAPSPNGPPPQGYPYPAAGGYAYPPPGAAPPPAGYAYPRLLPAMRIRRHSLPMERSRRRRRTRPTRTRPLRHHTRHTLRQPQRILRSPAHPHLQMHRASTNAGTLVGGRKVLL
jgi:hypothetical protein